MHTLTTLYPAAPSRAVSNFVPLLVESRSTRQCVNRIPPCLVSDMAVALRHPRHRARAPAHDVAHEGERDPGFQHARASGVPQIVKTAGDAGGSLAASHASFQLPMGCVGYLVP